jgi:sporulation protein YlmC with PRC-barrel domain
VKESDALLDAEDLIRLATITPARRALIHKSVFTRSGECIGKVADYVLNMETLSLTHLYVTKTFFAFTTEQRVLEWKQILEIVDTAVIVKDDLPGVKQEAVEQFQPLKKKVEATHGA